MPDERAPGGVQILRTGGKKLSVEELVEGLRTCGKANLCHGCPAYSISAEKCAAALKEQAADMLEKLAAEKDAKKPEWNSAKDGLPTCF